MSSESERFYTCARSHVEGSHARGVTVVEVIPECES